MRVFYFEADIFANEEEYLKVLAILVSQKIDSDITIKLHQFGLYFSVTQMARSVERVVTYFASCSPPHERLNGSMKKISCFFASPCNGWRQFKTLVGQCGPI